MQAIESERVHRLAPLARTLGAATAVGLILGMLIGGVGGRLAMRLLFLTSDPGVRGVESDDGFIIGQFTFDTLNLLGAGGVFGLLGAFMYLAIRPFLIGAPWVRSITCGIAAGGLMGHLLISADGVDFTALSPVSLAVTLFVAIPVLFGALCAPVTEWALRPEGWARNASVRRVAAPLLVFLFPPTLFVSVPTAIVLAVRWGVRRSLRLSAWTRHPAALWVGRFCWATFVAFGSLLLAEDMREVL